jgi:hypothetical protein
VAVLGGPALEPRPPRPPLTFGLLGAVSSADGTDGSIGMGVRFHRELRPRLRSAAILSMSCSEYSGGGPAGPAVDAWRTSGYLGLVPRCGSGSPRQRTMLVSRMFETYACG